MTMFKDFAGKKFPKQLVICKIGFFHVLVQIFMKMQPNETKNTRNV